MPAHSASSRLSTSQALEALLLATSAILTTRLITSDAAALRHGSPTAGEDNTERNLCDLMHKKSCKSHLF